MESSWLQDAFTAVVGFLAGLAAQANPVLTLSGLVFWVGALCLGLHAGCKGKGWTQME